MRLFQTLKNCDCIGLHAEGSDAQITAACLFHLEPAAEVVPAQHQNANFMHDDLTTPLFSSVAASLSCANMYFRQPWSLIKQV